MYVGCCGVPLRFERLNISTHLYNPPSRLDWGQLRLSSWKLPTGENNGQEMIRNIYIKYFQNIRLRAWTIKSFRKRNTTWHANAKTFLLFLARKYLILKKYSHACAIWFQPFGRTTLKLLPTDIHDIFQYFPKHCIQLVCNANELNTIE